jgi:DHA2 family multidrug resistance protein
VTWANAMAVETLNNFTQKFQGKGDAALMALKQLNQIVHRQATVMSFGDSFFLLTLFYVGLSTMVLLLAKPVNAGAGGGGH